MAKVLVPLAEGSEEIEAVTVIDVLRRAGAEVTVASVMTTKSIKASRGVNLVADCLIADCLTTKWDLIVLPGGMPGAEYLAQNAQLIQLVRQQLQADKWLGAICAAPAVVLAQNQLIEHRRATCHPAFQQKMMDCNVIVEQNLVSMDSNLITSQAPGTAMKFVITLVGCLFGEQKAEEVALPMVLSD